MKDDNLLINTIIQGDALSILRTLPDKSIHCVVTSPPYWGLRDYGVEPSVWEDGWRGPLGLEPTSQLYVRHLVQIFREVKRILRQDGTLWLNIGDCYVGSGKNADLKPKNLAGIPWRVAFALQSDGWLLRSDIIWHKPNSMPESAKDRPTRSHEYIFLMSKGGKYFFDSYAVREVADYDGRKDEIFKGCKKLYHGVMPDGMSQMFSQRGHPRWRKDEHGVRYRNIRSVWKIPTQPFRGSHFAIFPERLAWLCVKAGCPNGGIVLDPFMGSGTVGVVAKRLGRGWIGIELNPKYVEIAKKRIDQISYQKELFD